MIWDCNFLQNKSEIQTDQGKKQIMFIKSEKILKHFMLTPCFIIRIECYKLFIAT
jgi:hypothetical protein